MFKIDRMIAASTAIQKLLITKLDPIKAAVIHSVMALIINKKKPNVNTVTGRVKIIKTGFTIKLMIDRSKLARMAALIPEM